LAAAPVFLPEFFGKERSSTGNARRHAAVLSAKEIINDDSISGIHSIFESDAAIFDGSQSQFYSCFGEIICFIIGIHDGGLSHHLLDECHRQNPEQR
jgi:hypothetical protein